MVAKPSNDRFSWVIVLLMFSAVLSLALAVPMLLSRIFPEDGAFPAVDSVYLYATVAQVSLIFVIGVFVVLLALFRSEWEFAAVVMAVPGLVVLVLAGPRFGMFPDFLFFLLALGLMLGVAALRRSSEPVRARVRAAAPLSASGNSDDQRALAERFPALAAQRNFSNIVGMSAVKERLQSAAAEIVAERDDGEPPRNGILLFGEPGNGKTVFAEALAGELDLPILTATFGDVASKWINQTTEQVVAVFEAARVQAPCVLFIDEIDSLIRDRDRDGNVSEESSRTTNAILTELVRIRSSQVVLVAATNYIDRLDPAAIREGRFDFRVEITPPDEPARAALLRAPLDDMQMAVDESAVATAARRWDGFSVARIRAVAEEAGRSTRLDGGKCVAYRDLQSALRRVQGRAGNLPENTLGLDGLTLPARLAQTLHGLAARMINVEQVEALGGRIPSGVLFHGEPGTGKTVAARALAKEAGWAFLACSGNELLAEPAKIDALVRKARDLRPAIIFIDEADDLLADRTYAAHSASATNRLLSAMDGAAGRSSDVIWIAATNHPENLDGAAVRGGRFTVKVEFELPDSVTVESFVQRWLAECKAEFCDALTPAEIAGYLHGVSLANVQAVLQHAVDVMVERWMADRDQGAARVEIADLECARQAVLGR